MKQLLLLLSLMALVMMPLHESAGDPGAETGTITGRLTDSVSGDPIASAWVAVIQTNQGAATDADGKKRTPGRPITAQPAARIRQ